MTGGGFKSVQVLLLLDDIWSPHSKRFLKRCMNIKWNNESVFSIISTKRLKTVMKQESDFAINTD